MKIRDYFPLGIASGNAFCNRNDETTTLISNMQNGKHTLLVATRRYGKSSLAIRAIEKSGLPFIEVDFYMATSEKIIEAYILNGVVELIGKALGPVDKLITSIKKYIKSLHPKINIATEHFQLELQPGHGSDPATNVKEALSMLEKLLSERGQQAVFLMDEFQNVGVVAEGKGIEAAIRHVAQKSKYLTIVFSGSNRKMLQTMFDDENRPLYKLCWKLSLNRITAKHYQDHIQKAAKLAWGAPIDESIIDKILSLTERHPYYVNKLCDRVWTDCSNKQPTEMDIEKAWMSVIEEERSDAIKEISALAAGQKSVLLQIAKNPASQLTSKQTLMDMHMTGSSVMTALDGLEEKDVIERDSEGCRIINPVIKYYVLKDAR